jgi:phosphoribosylamine--glycine ligase
MLTDDGPLVLEFNARFGDPEAQVLVPMLEGSLATALLGAAEADRSLMEGSLAWRAGAAVGLVLASEGYPGDPAIGRRLGGCEPASAGDAGHILCFHAATRRTPAGYESIGGRVATFVGRGPDIATARARAYDGIRAARLDGGRYREDIAARELAAGATTVG